MELRHSAGLRNIAPLGHDYLSPPPSPSFRQVILKVRVYYIKSFFND